jgi:hypothetical protein
MKLCPKYAGVVGLRVSVVGLVVVLVLVVLGNGFFYVGIV